MSNFMQNMSIQNDIRRSKEEGLFDDRLCAMFVSIQFDIQFHLHNFEFYADLKYYIMTTRIKQS